MKIYQEEGRGFDAFDIQVDNAAILASRKILRKISRDVAKINKQLSSVAMNRSISPEQREKTLDALRKQRNALTKQIEPLLDFF
jgi:cell division protein FtsB